MRDAEDHWVRAGGTPVYAREWGGAGPASPPAVLVHGLGMSGRYLVPTAERLAADFRVYAPDLPGFGRSPGPARALDVPELADALAGWMDARAVSGAVLLGNSLGCQIILALATHRPDLAGAVVLVGPTADPRGRSVARLVARAAADVLREDPALYPIIARAYLRAGPRRTWRTLRHLVADRPEDRLPLVGAPALVVRGGRDAIVPAAWAAEVARRLPRGRLLTVPGAAHAVNFGAPGPLAAAVRALAAEAGLTRCPPAS